MEAKALAETQQQFTRVGRGTLIERLKEAREIHVEAYDEAVEGWIRKYIEGLKKASEDCLQEAKRAEAPDVTFKELKTPYLDLPERPLSHEGDYDEAITRYEMSLDDEIWLSNQDFNRYILDKWRWKGSFLDSVSSYASEATVASVARGKR